ncbi:MAG: hypothetical protein E7527_06160 [Ruminococcaceae bacterium]|nr:hypothetical protein [Oscillospiraceae bacterium]
MITIQDWLATIPEEDKHLAYVGEHQAVTRKFLLTGSDWKTYQDWGFHLDMAFDLSTVTSKAKRQMETTQVNTTENVSDTLVKTNGTTTKEKYTVTEVDVDCADKTDIATLKKNVLTNGIQLTWTVLRQHTQLPGKLKATLRALGPDGQVKKSDLMVFEVDPAVVAESAADIPQSEFEAMEERMDWLLDEAQKNAQMVELHLEAVETALEESQSIKEQVDDTLSDTKTVYNQTVAVKNQAEQTVKSLYAVQYVAQILTEEQKNHARTNIGAAGETDLLDLHHGVGQLSDQASQHEQSIATLEQEMDWLRRDTTGTVYTTASDAVNSSIMRIAQQLHQEIEALAQRVSALEQTCGEIDGALDGILALQQTLIGGGNE